MKLIYDIDSNSEILISNELNESTGKEEKKYKIRGIFSTIGEKNRNGRVYPQNVWINEVLKYQENIKNGTVNTLMEWDHPARSNVDPMEAVAKITSLQIDGKCVMGEAVLLNNSKANQIKSLIENGIKISVSSRGVGFVKNGVVEGFKLITYDLVSEPSDFNATMNGVVESYSLNEGVLQDKTFFIDKHNNIKELDSSRPNESNGIQDKEQVINTFLKKLKEIII